MNKDVAEKVFEAVFAFETNHRQSKWFDFERSHLNDGDEVVVDYDAITAKNVCGTSACLAGWATLAAGYKIEVQGHQDEWHNLVLIDPTGGEETSGYADLSLYTYGRDALELSDDVADLIFYTMDEVTAISLLFSVYETGSPYALQDEVLEEVRNRPSHEENDEYDVDLAQIIYDRAKAKFGPKAKVDA